MSNTDPILAPHLSYADGGSLGFDEIPKSLRNLDQWVLWREEKRDDRTTKIPYQPNQQRAKSNDPDTWCSLSTAREALESGDLPMPDGSWTGNVWGLGFVFSTSDLIVGLDLDDCVEGSKLTSVAQRIVEGIDSYAEWSPSGDGLHILCRGVKPVDSCKALDVPGMKEIEIYEDGRFFTFTGHRIDGRPQSVNVCRESLHEVCHWAFTDEDDEKEPTPSSNGTPKRDLSETEIWDLIEQADDDKIQRLWSGDTSLNDHDHSRADSALCCKLYFYGADKHQIDELFRQSGLMRPKWDEQRGNQTYGEMTIQNAIDEVDERHSALTDDSAGDSRTANGAPSGDGQAGNAPGMPNSAPFWYFDAEKEKTKIERAGLIQFLEDHGFGKLYAESDLDSMLVRVEDNIVRHTSREKIKDFVLGYVRKVQPKREAQVIDALLRGANVYFSDALFEFLSPVEPDFHEDTPEKAFFYYENGFVEVTADGFDLQPYSDLDGVIWEDQIINREFKTLTDEGPSGWDWHEHLLNVAGHDSERHNAICTGLGYLMHDYKDPAVTKAIIFMDEKVTDVEEGRTGKSVTTEALQYMGSTLRVDGRNFSFDSRFAFQEVTLDTAVVDFNDAKKRFPFERLFSLITDDFPVERKGKDRVTIPFEDSPKFALSTNYVIEGKGASFQDRTFQVEFADYYSPRHSPKDEFGHRLFDDWDADEWARFDNVMMACVRQYLRDGLASYDHVNIQEKKLRQETCPDFAEWIRDFIELGRRYDKKALKKSFQEAYAPDYEDMTGYQCTTWVKTFARIYDLDVSEPKSGSTRYIVLRDTDEK